MFYQSFIIQLKIQLKMHTFIKMDTTRKTFCIKTSLSETDLIEINKHVNDIQISNNGVLMCKRLGFY